MTIHSASPRSIGLRLPVLKALGVAVGITALTATGALAAQHETKPQQGQTQPMPGPSFARMQEMMQKAGLAKDPPERAKHVRQTMQMKGEKIQAQRSMVGDMPSD